MEQATTKLARPLKVLVPLIKNELKAAERAGMEHYRAAGEMLLEAKAQLRHGEFQDWYKKQGFGWSPRSAREYMNLVERENGGVRRFETLEESKVHPRTRAPLPELRPVDVEALRREEQARHEERKKVCDLELQIIKLGYRLLAEKHHPDKHEGSNEDMSRLNRARSHLLSWL